MEEGKKRRGRRTKPNDQTQTKADNQENMVQMLTFLGMDPARTLASSREGTASEESQQRTRVCFKGKREMNKSCSTQKHNLNRLALAPQTKAVVHPLITFSYYKPRQACQGQLAGDVARWRQCSYSMCEVLGSLLSNIREGTLISALWKVHM